MTEELKEDTKEPINYFTLFKHFFLFSTFAFGDGTTIISMIKERFVNRLRWIDDDELNSMLSIAATAPGAIVINVSVLIAYRLLGVRGVLLGIFAALLSPIAAICFIEMIYQKIAGNAVVENMMHGIKSAAAAIIFVVVLDMIVKIFQKKNPGLIGLLAICFVLIHFYHVNILILMGVCVAIGTGITIYNKKHRKESTGE